MPPSMGESGCGHYQWVRDFGGHTLELGYALITHITHSFQMAAHSSSRPLSRLAGVFLPVPSKGDVEKCLNQMMA